VSIIAQKKEPAAGLRPRPVIQDPSVPEN